MVFKRRTKRSIGQIVMHSVYPPGGWRRSVSYIVHRVRRLPDKPHRIARGVAVGLFVSFTPFFGLHLFISAGIAWLIGGNVFAALLATLFGNPITFPFMMAIAIGTGNFLLHQPNTLHLPLIMSNFARASLELWGNFGRIFIGGEAHWGHLRWFFDRIFWPYLVGGIFPGTVFGLIGYYLTLPIVGAYQKRRTKNLRERVEKLRAVKAAEDKERPAARGQEG